jgi:CBS domain-containing protein
MKVQDVMAKNVITARPDESVTAVAKLMREGDVGCVIVADGPAVKGIITDRDLAVRCLGNGDNPQSCVVSRHMTDRVITAPPEADVFVAARMMTENKIKRLPISQGGALVGVVSFSDIALAMDQPLHNLMVGMGAARQVERIAENPWLGPPLPYNP